MDCSQRVWVSIRSVAELGNASKGAARGGQFERDRPSKAGVAKDGRGEWWGCIA